MESFYTSEMSLRIADADHGLVFLIGVVKVGLLHFLNAQLQVNCYVLKETMKLEGNND